MINLIKCELYRFFKSKYFLILAIIGLAFSIIVPLLEFALKKAISNTAEIYGATAQFSFSAMDRMQGALNPSALFGFLIPIFILVLLTQDYRNGTIRIKITSGVSKLKIMASNYIVSFIFMLVLMLGYGLFSFLFSLIFFPVVPEEVTLVGKYVGYFFLTLLYDIIQYAFIVSLVILLVTLIRTPGLCAFVLVIATFGLQFVGTMLGYIVSYLETYETNMESLITFVSVFNWINPFYLAGTLTISEYSTALLVSNIVTPVAFFILNAGLGYLAFIKKDIK